MIEMDVGKGEDAAFLEANEMELSVVLPICCFEFEELMRAEITRVSHKHRGHQIEEGMEVTTEIACDLVIDQEVLE